MKTVGRIILFVVAIVILALTVPGLVVSIQTMNALGWDNLFFSQEKIALLLTIITAGIDALFGLVALIGGIRGKKSLKLALCALIMAIAPTIAVVQGVQNGSFSDWKFVFQIVASYTLPLFYMLGFLLV